MVSSRNDPSAVFPITDGHHAGVNVNGTNGGLDGATMVLRLGTLGA